MNVYIVVRLFGQNKPVGVGQRVVNKLSTCGGMPPMNKTDSSDNLIILFQERTPSHLTDYAVSR